jgi:hypothetical protein
MSVRQHWQFDKSKMIISILMLIVHVGREAPVALGAPGGGREAPVALGASGGWRKAPVAHGWREAPVALGAPGGGREAPVALGAPGGWREAPGGGREAPLALGAPGGWREALVTLGAPGGWREAPVTLSSPGSWRGAPVALGAALGSPGSWRGAPVALGTPGGWREALVALSVLSGERDALVALDVERAAPFDDFIDGEDAAPLNVYIDLSCYVDWFEGWVYSMYHDILILSRLRALSISSTCVPRNLSRSEARILARGTLRHLRAAAAVRGRGNRRLFSINFILAHFIRDTATTSSTQDGTQRSHQHSGRRRSRGTVSRAGAPTKRYPLHNFI